MERFDLTEHAHRRFNLLTGEWVLVSPHRTKRPWQGQVEKLPPETRPAYDPTCYLCPGNSRAGGVSNPQYTSTFVFDNDFAALLPNDVAAGAGAGSDLLRAEPTRGICRVLCFSPRHDLTLAEMEREDLRKVVDAWAQQTEELGRENRRRKPARRASTSRATAATCCSTTSESRKKPRGPAEAALSATMRTGSRSCRSGPSGRSRHLCCRGAS